MAAKSGKGKKGTQRKLTAILSADVHGYSRLMGADEEATIETLTAYRKVFLSHIEGHSGRVVDAKGDAILAEFASVVDAVSSAVEIQRELAEQNADLSDDRRMDFRIGINLGDVVVKDDAIYGDGVNVAARLEALAEPGGICISRPVFDQVESKLNLECEYLGEQQVKNIAKPVRAYRVKLTHAEIESTDEGDATVGAPPEMNNGHGIPTLAVLPFVNMSGDVEQEYFSDGITEDLITDLSKLSRLSVTARNTAFTYKGKAVNVQQVGKELGVRYVLEGSVRKAANMVRITAQLIDTGSGNHVWAERYDRTLEDIFKVQDEITGNIVMALNVRLLEGEQAKIWRKSTQSAEAYDLFLQGLNHYRNNQNPAGVSQARGLFEQAVELDSGFTRALTTLAHTHTMDAFWGLSEDPDESLEKSFTLARQVLALDESNAHAYSVLGINYTVTAEFDRGIEEAERAVRLNPNSADITARLANCQIRAGQPELGVRTMRKAMSFAPHYPAWFNRTLGWGQLLLDRYEESITSFKDCLAGSPGNLAAHTYLAAAYAAVNRIDDANREIQEVLNLHPGFNIRKYKMGEKYRNETEIRMIALLRKAGLPD